MSASDKKKLRKEQSAAALTEKQQNQKKQDKQLQTYTMTFAIIMILVVAIGLGSIGVSWINNTGMPARGTVALTIGDYEMNSAELNYYYIDTINNFYNSMYKQYGEYTVFYLQYLYKLDLTAPLDEQIYNEETKETWADYFLGQAIESARTTYAMYNDSKAAGYEMSEEFKTQLANTLTSTEAMAGYYGFKSLNDYLRAVYGTSANVDTYVQYLTASNTADAYSHDYYYAQEISNEMIETHNTEHYNDFSTFNYSHYYLSVADYARLIDSGIIDPVVEENTEADAPAEAAEEPTGETEGTKPADNDKKEEEKTFTAEELTVAADAAKADAEWLAEAQTKLIFEKKLNLMKSNVNKKTLTVLENKMLTAVDKLYAEWLSDSEREIGDCAFFAYESETDKDEIVDGYYVVMFDGRNDYNDLMVNVRHVLFKFEGGKKDENNVMVYSDEEKQKAYNEAKAAYDEWLAGEVNEDTFAELAKKKSDDSSASNGGLIENIFPGQTVTNFNDWIFNADRKAGDHALIETEYGYHIIYFSSWDEMTYRQYCIDGALRSEALEKWYDAIVKDIKAVKGDLKHINTSIVVASSGK